MSEITEYVHWVPLGTYAFRSLCGASIREESSQATTWPLEATCMKCIELMKTTALTHSAGAYQRQAEPGRTFCGLNREAVTVKIFARDVTCEVCHTEMRRRPDVVDEKKEKRMGFSHKTAIVEGTKALEDWVAKNEIEEQVNWAGFRDALNTLNPELHGCGNDECSVDTWTGAVNDCPACDKVGEKIGRRVK